jgi:hypothetical protein
MRRARIVRIEWDTKLIDGEITDAVILASIAPYYGLIGLVCLSDNSITVTGEPSFTIKESDE